MSEDSMMFIFICLWSTAVVFGSTALCVWMSK